MFHFLNKIGGFDNKAIRGIILLTTFFLSSCDKNYVEDENPLCTLYLRGIYYSLFNSLNLGIIKDGDVDISVQGYSNGVEYIINYTDTRTNYIELRDTVFGNYQFIIPKKESSQVINYYNDLIQTASFLPDKDAPIFENNGCTNYELTFNGKRYEIIKK